MPSLDQVPWSTDFSLCVMGWALSLSGRILLVSTYLCSEQKYMEDTQHSQAPSFPLASWLLGI